MTYCEEEPLCNNKNVIKTGRDYFLSKNDEGLNCNNKNVIRTGRDYIPKNYHKKTKSTVNPLVPHSSRYLDLISSQRFKAIDTSMTKKSNYSYNISEKKSERINYNDGSYYIGHINTGFRSGFGTWYYWNDQKKYEGEWKLDQRNGKGTSYWQNGNIWFQGNWNQNYWNGSGILYDIEGKEKANGFWHNGEIIKSNNFIDLKYGSLYNQHSYNSESLVYLTDRHVYSINSGSFTSRTRFNNSSVLSINDRFKKKENNYLHPNYKKSKGCLKLGSMTSRTRGNEHAWHEFILNPKKR